MIHNVSNPIIQTLVNRLRNVEPDALRFRHLVQELARLLSYEALKALPLQSREIETWHGKERFEFIDETQLIFVPVLRAGLPMLESVSALFPNASSGFLAMKRDEKTHQSVIYYDRIPECENKIVILLDPMVATAGSLCDAVSFVKTKQPKQIISLNVIASPEGLEVLEHKHPDITLYIAQVDKTLDENKFIYPGLGDAGDRSYNTKG